MSRQKRPNWVLPFGDWEFLRHKRTLISFKRLADGRTEVTEDRSGVLIELGRTNTYIPEWWEDGFDIKNGPTLKFCIKIINRVPTISALHIESNDNYPFITNDDIVEVSRNHLRIITWAVREIASSTTLNQDGSIQVLPSRPISEKEWYLLGKEVQRLAGRHTVTNEHLKEIAEIYTKAQKEGRPTTKAIQDRFHYSASRARVLVVEARKEKLLDPVVKKGKKNATSRNK
jgi:hypothetical protein